MRTSAQRCPDCNEPTPCGGWVDQIGRVHHVGCGDPLGQKARDARIAELEAAVLAAKALLEPTTDATESAWQILDNAYHAYSTQTE